MENTIIKTWELGEGLSLVKYQNSYGRIFYDFHGKKANTEIELVETGFCQFENIEAAKVKMMRRITTDLNDVAEIQEAAIEGKRRNPKGNYDCKKFMAKADKAAKVLRRLLKVTED